MFSIGDMFFGVSPKMLQDMSVTAALQNTAQDIAGSLFFKSIRDPPEWTDLLQQHEWKYGHYKDFFNGLWDLICVLTRLFI